jgi:hypothetical protein
LAIEIGLGRHYFVLNTCRSDVTRLIGTIFILAHPLPLVSARLVPGREREGKQMLSAGRLLSAQKADGQGKSICSGILDKT